jgi:hypothetical protein
LASTSQAQPVEQGWKGIRPLITNRETVETVLGKRVWVDGNAYYAYDTDDAFIQVNYSTAPCAENRYGRGKYNVPVGTVLGYTVNLKKIVKLADIRFDRPKYFKDTGGDVHNSWYYVNVDAGTSIGAFAQDAEGDELDTKQERKWLISLGVKGQ